MGQNLIDAVKAAGVIGAGGAGFPTHVKLAARVDTVIANGAECDPLLQCDQRLMERHALKLVRGLQLAMAATGAEHGIVALKKEYSEAIAALQRAVSSALKASGSQPDLRLHLLDSRYPAGDEFVLVYETTGRVVPEAGLPLHVGCLVQNVQTLFNINRAAEGRPVTHRLLTVAGAVARPVTLWVPVGTPIRDVLAWAGGIRPANWSQRTGQDYAVVAGGPMMGQVPEDLDQPVTKMTSGLLVLPRDNAVVRYLTRSRRSWVRRGISTCDQCRDCTDLCPRYLLGHDLKPHEVMRAINYGLERPADKVTAAILCCECRLCEAYACPLELSPMSYYVAIKEQLRAQGWRPERRQGNDNPEPHPMRDCRLVPTHRLIARLGLTEWEDQVCPLDETDYCPARVTIPLRHPRGIGVPAVAAVAVGQKVAVGAPIAHVPEGKLGANVHASIAGQVSQVAEAAIEIVS
ncbi:MAG: SLBB domain-containing protein [Anaerolineae bacterium]|nr:SLBB domain-containing protein [Anaerolineae bacterium]